MNNNNNFILPEKWYIKRDRDNHTIINEWFNKNQPIEVRWTGNNGNMNYPRFSNQIIPNLSDHDSKLEEYTEITFDQFKKYVLKKDNTITYDKIKVGKWYYFESYTTKATNIIRCDSIDKHYISTNNWIMLHNKQTSGSGTWNHSEINNIKEVSIDEIQQYLLDGHPDKIKTMEKQVIKVGDTVRCINNINDNSKGSGWENGYEFKVTKIDTIGVNRYIYWGGVNGNGVYSNSVELVSKVKPNITKPEDHFKNKTWYISKTTGSLVFHEKYGPPYLYGIVNGTKWIDKLMSIRGLYDAKSYWKEANREEIENALLKAAENKGFVKGAKYNSVKSVRNWINLNNQIINTIAYFEIGDTLYTSKGVIYHDGKWGEVIEKPTMSISDLVKKIPSQMYVSGTDPYDWHKEIYKKPYPTVVADPIWFEKPLTPEESFKKKEDPNKIDLNIKKSNKKSKFALQIKQINKVKF